MSVVEHAKALIRCPSVTPIEGGAIRYIQSRLNAAGFDCHWLTFQEAGTPDVDNLYARLGTGSPHICFAGHTDVVPPGHETNWTHAPFAADVADGVLYGRGACDMKGGVAASLAAALQYIEARGGDLNGSISFLITGDEEGASINGTAKVVKWLIERGERPDACILPECTSEDRLGDIVKIGRRGSVSSKLTVRGVQGHVAYPYKSKNPIPLLIKALTALTEHPLDAGSGHFQPSNLEITGIDTGNSAHNVIPAAVTAKFNIRFNTHHTGDSLKAWMNKRIGEALSGSGRTYSLEHEEVSDCFLTIPGPFVDVLLGAIKSEIHVDATLATNGGTSDARFIKDLCPVVEVGLLNESAHKVDEHVSLADLDNLTRIFRRVLGDLRV